MVIGDLARQPDWSDLVRDVDVVIHCAAKVHIRQEHASGVAAAFRAVNVEGSVGLATAASAAGCRRFVFLSTAKLLAGGGAECLSDAQNEAEWRSDPYTASKREGERALQACCARSGMELVIVRPPLVYGPGAGGNFRSLMRAVASGLPLPLGAIRNRRSFIALENLVDFLATVAIHPSAAGRTFEVCDGEDLSTEAFVRKLASAMGRRTWIPSVPVALLRGLAAVIGRRSQMTSLSESLVLDMTEAVSLLGWTPPVRMDVALKNAVGAACKRSA
jgi:nucleoside-diphosphate-sugar epimerase